MRKLSQFSLEKNAMKTFIFLFNLLPGYAPALILFLMIPIGIYVSNQAEFGHNIGIVILFIELSALYFLILVFLILIMNAHASTKFIKFLFFMGIYLLLSDIFAPVQVGEIFGAGETPEEPLLLSIFEIVIIIALVIISSKLPWDRIKTSASVFVLVLIVAQVITLLTALPYDIRSESKDSTARSQIKMNESGNIYHITFDGFSGKAFQNALKKLDAKSAFDGFTLFQNTRANYDHTRPSVASYMTGTFYKEGNFSEWHNSYKSRGVLREFQGEGYELSTYVRDAQKVAHNASFVLTGHQFLKNLGLQQITYFQFADIWLLRIVPNFLQQEVFQNGKGVFSEIFADRKVPSGSAARPFAAVGIMKELTKDEVKRPDHGQYVYAHIYIPHSPYVMDAKCNFTPTEAKFWRVTYVQQADCAMRLMTEFTSELKRLNRYDKATIIFNSDHGSPLADHGYSERAMSPGILSQYNNLNIGGVGGAALNGMTNALLMIKPPSTTGEVLVVSHHQAQLVDIPATLYALKGLSKDTEQGSALFEDSLPKTRDINIFTGFLQRSKKNGTIKWGFLHDGEAGHLTYNESTGWSILPPVMINGI